jgi:biotin carboxyl carrier protein
MDVRSLVNDARVLLGQLRQSQWGELHLRTPQGEIFIARHGGRPNPMRRSATQAVAAAEDAGVATSLAAGHVVRAPHVGTVLAALPARARVEANGVVCRLSVLGEAIAVSSPHAGVVGEVFAVNGALVEYDSPLFTVVRTQ